MVRGLGFEIAVLRQCMLTTQLMQSSTRAVARKRPPCFAFAFDKQGTSSARGLHDRGVVIHNTFCVSTGGEVRFGTADDGSARLLERQHASMIAGENKRKKKLKCPVRKTRTGCSSNMGDTDNVTSCRRTG